MCAFRFYFKAGKSIEIRLRMCGPPLWNDKNWYPSYEFDDMDQSVPFPVHVQGIKSWASTKIKQKKWKDKAVLS